ncbi:hypothetical protein ACQ5TV_05820 [Acetobacter ghanensis]|uniref:hypothetical protein n=1 Tax=Acetobacter ghanensis TaxID=431306 RepID=UPI003D33BDC5
MRTREEQIEELVDALKKSVCRPDYSVDILRRWLEKHIEEAEHRAEQRVREEIGRDSERLDWLAPRSESIEMAKNGPVLWRSRFKTMSRIADFRSAIDAAREVG